MAYWLWNPSSHHQKNFTKEICQEILLVGKIPVALLNKLLWLQLLPTEPTPFVSYKQWMQGFLWRGVICILLLGCLKSVLQSYFLHRSGFPNNLTDVNRQEFQKSLPASAKTKLIWSWLGTGWHKGGVFSWSWSHMMTPVTGRPCSAASFATVNGMPTTFAPRTNRALKRRSLSADLPCGWICHTHCPKQCGAMKTFRMA